MKRTSHLRGVSSGLDRAGCNVLESRKPLVVRTVSSGRFLDGGFKSQCGGRPMLLVWGSKLYGRVDDVPGMFYVATRFGHLWYLPLIPMGSFVVLERQGKIVSAVP